MKLEWWQKLIVAFLWSLFILAVILGIVLISREHGQSINIINFIVTFTNGG